MQQDSNLVTTPPSLSATPVTLTTPTSPQQLPLPISKPLQGQILTQQGVQGTSEQKAGA